MCVFLFVDLGPQSTADSAPPYFSFFFFFFFLFFLPVNAVSSLHTSVLDTRLWDVPYVRPILPLAHGWGVSEAVSLLSGHFRCLQLGFCYLQL